MTDALMPSVFSEAHHKARKSHVCDECRAAVLSKLFAAACVGKPMGGGK